MHSSLRRLTACLWLALVSLPGCHHGGTRTVAGPREPGLTDGSDHTNLNAPASAIADRQHIRAELAARR